MSKSNKKIIIKMRNRTERLERENDYWSDEERLQLRTMFYEGVGVTEMALTLKRTEPAIFQQIEKDDLYGRKSNPQRRRSSVKRSICLCASCTADPSICPLINNCL